MVFVVLTASLYQSWSKTKVIYSRSSRLLQGEYGGMEQGGEGGEVRKQV